MSLAITKSGLAGRNRTCLVLISLGGTVGLTNVAHGLVINPTFDTTITGLSNASQWENAINFADQQYENLLTDPITINLTFVAGGGLGESNTPLQLVTNGYSGMKSALANDSKSANDATSIAHLPATDPTGGANFIVSNAQSKALNLGIFPANGTENDGTVTLGKDTANGGSNNYTFDPNNRAVAGDYDFIGVVEHEVSEVMGRIGILGNTLGSGQPFYGALDLFGYTGAGALDLKPNQAGVNFSINGGQTLLKLYNNGSNGGDNKDWASGFTPDSYDAFATLGAEADITPVDKIQMDVIGYDPAAVRNLTWNQVGGKWNRVSTNQPWLNSASAAYYSDSDTANFTNTTAGAVTIDSIGVSPATTNVSNSSGNYTFTGGGILSGALIKTNGGILTLSNSHNAFTSVMVSGGTLDVETNGSGSTLPANISITNSNSLIINDSAATTATQITGSGATTIGGSGNVTVGTLTQGTVSNAGTLTIGNTTTATTSTITNGINNSNGTSTQGSTTIASAANVSVGNVLQNSLTVNGKLSIIPGPVVNSVASASGVNSLTIAGTPTAPTGTLDLGNSKMVIDYAAGSGTSPDSTIRSEILSGLNGGAWTGTGITSSTAAASAVANKGVSHYEVFWADGNATDPITHKPLTQTVAGLTAGEELFEVTQAGDANADGTVGDADFVILATHFGQSTTLGPAAGDFDYDGTVGDSDFVVLATNFGLGTAFTPNQTQRV